MGEENDNTSSNEDLTRIEDLGEYQHEDAEEAPDGEESTPEDGDSAVAGEEEQPPPDGGEAAPEDGDWAAGEESAPEDGDWAAEEAPDGGEAAPEDGDWAAEEAPDGGEAASEDGDWAAAEAPDGEESAPEDGDWAAAEAPDGEESAPKDGDWAAEEAPDGGEAAPESESPRAEAPEPVEPAEVGGEEERESDPVSIARENFEELRHFAEAITYGNVAARGNPPFTIIVGNIRYREDANGIMALLCDHNICTDENRKDFELGLEQGAIIIPQIGEYSAIYLAHKLRRFDVDIRMGLSDEIRPSPSYEREGRGLISKYNVPRNIREEVSLERELMDLEDILESTSSSLEGHRIREHLGVVVAHALMEEDEFLEESEGEFRKLLQSLKCQAVERQADGVVDIQYQTIKLSKTGGPLYKVTCTGNAVGVERDEP